jgi:hypothetical protein
MRDYDARVQMRGVATFWDDLARREEMRFGSAYGVRGEASPERGNQPATRENPPAHKR